MRGFDAFGDIFPGLNFAELDSARDWQQTGGPWNDGNSYSWHVNGGRIYTPPAGLLFSGVIPSGQSFLTVTPNWPTLQAAVTNWTGLQNAATIYPAGSAQGLLNSWTTTLQGWITKVDNDTRNPTTKPAVGLWTYPVTRVDNYNGLNDALTQLSQITVPDPDAELQADQDAAAAAAAQVAAKQQQQAATQQAALAKTQNTQAAIEAAKQAIAQATAATAAANAHAAVVQQTLSAQTAAATAAAPSDSDYTPVVLGVLGVAVIGAGIYAFSRSKKSAVAGYRKRRRR